MQHSLRFAVVTALVSLAACAGAPSQRSAGARGQGGDAAVAALYQRLDADSLRYTAALERAPGADAEAARGELKAALDDLRTAATQCTQLPGCDQARFVAAFDGLLRRGIGVEEAASNDDDGGGTTPEATAEAGESSPVVASLPELGRSITLLKGRELGDIIALNGPVKAALETWLTQYRPNLIDAYENYRYMRHLMWPEYEKAGLPEALLFGMMAKESGGKVHAVSRSGASGPLQFMYATGLRFGLSTADGFDQRFDPQLSARANAAYVNEQLAIFNNNLELVIGAYNGGEGAMRRRVAAVGGAPSFWDPKVYYDVSPETRDYVPMVLAAAWLFMHPERYNLQFPKIPDHAGSITLKRPASIAELTICLGQDGGNLYNGWFRTLRNLNPQLDPKQREPAGAKLVVPRELEAVYARDCADGKWPELAAELHAAIAPPVSAGVAVRTSTAARTSAKGQTYLVRKGDSLFAIARKNGCDLKEVAAANGLRGPHYHLKPGQALTLTGCAR
jgi:membrane-bound lytic murein transglycosylase D